MPLGSWQQELYDGLLAAAGDKATELKEMWDEVLQEVLRTASESVPYDSNQDTWHAPTTAVWFAAWTAALVVAHLFLSRPLPVDLLTQWRWYVEGRWPCAYAARTEEETDRFCSGIERAFLPKVLLRKWRKPPTSSSCFNLGRERVWLTIIGADCTPRVCSGNATRFQLCTYIRRCSYAVRH
jgi:hypothetical protein